MIEIRNKGPEILGTNYWQTPHCQRGYAFLSWNAGAARLLLPRQLWASLPDMEEAGGIIISQGPWVGQGDREALEVMFEDGSDAPYAIHLLSGQSDRPLSVGESGRAIIASVWTERGKCFERPGRYRVVSAIPCMTPWSDSEAT